MGLLNYLSRPFKKENKNLTLIESKLQTAFSFISSDIKHLQKEWKKLHSGHELTKQDIKNISLWLGYLKRDAEKAEENFEKISAWLGYLNEQNEKSKKILENHEIELKSLKQHVATGVALQNLNELEPNPQESENDVATGVANTCNVANVAFATPTTHKDLPYPLKTLLNLMISIGEPVQYKMLAQKLGKNKITIRVNMNRLKRRGAVEEFTTPNGSKLFAVKNIEKIKKLYNVEMI